MTRFSFSEFSYFFRYKPLKLISIFLSTLIQGFTQGITIVLLIPLLGLLDHNQAASSGNKWADMINPLFDTIGVRVSLPLIL